MRELADVERGVLARLLSVEFDGAEALRKQAASILGVEPGCTCGCPTITLRVDRDAAPPVHVGPLLPTELVEVDRLDGIPRTVLCFLDPDGYLASLECVYYDDARPQWPSPDQCDVLLRDAGATRDSAFEGLAQLMRGPRWSAWARTLVSMLR